MFAQFIGQPDRVEARPGNHFHHCGKDPRVMTITDSTLTPDLAAKLKFCDGCTDDFYNHRAEPGFDGATHCWSLETAKVVTRFKLHWWTAPTVPGAFQEVRTLSCRREPGKFAFYKELPTFAVDAIRLKDEAGQRG